MSRRPAVALAVLLAGAVLTGCGSSTVTAAPAAAANTTTVAAAATVAPTSAPADPKPALQAGLLTPKEVGDGFTAQTYVAPGADDTLSCGQPGLAARFPSVLVGTAMGRGQDVALIEAVNVYADVATAKQALAAVADGLGCGSGTTVDGTPATIGPADDVTAQVGGEQVQMWMIDAKGTSIIVIAAQAREALLQFSFVAGPTVDSSTLPHATDVAKKGLAKLLAA